MRLFFEKERQQEWHTAMVYMPQSVATDSGSLQFVDFQVVQEKAGPPTIVS